MEMKITSRQCQDELGTPHRFDYYLTVDSIVTDRFFCEDYGVRITEESGSTCTIPSITTSAVRIDELISLLVEQRVGPVGLSDVVADWL